jgi:hypothetical protein
MRSMLRRRRVPSDLLTPPMRSLRSLCFLLALAPPSTALASNPGGWVNSQVPVCISLVGSVGGVPATAVGEFVVIMRDLANNPVPGVVVAINLSASPDLRLCADQLDPAVTVNCAGKIISKLSAADGSARFTLLGGSTGTGNAVTLLYGGRIFANGSLIATPTVSTYDLDGTSGVGANDLSAWLHDFASGQPYGRSDYDCSNTIGANDLSMWLVVFGSGAMAQSCGASCP